MQKLNDTQPAQPALQAHSRPIVVARRNRSGVTHSRTGSFRRLSALSGAVVGRSSALLLIWMSLIHNHRLSIHPHENEHFLCLARKWTRVPRSSGTLPESRQNTSAVARRRVERAACFSLDRGGYTCAKRRRGSWTRVLRIPSRRLGSENAPAPVKAGPRNGPSRTHPGSIPLLSCTQPWGPARRGTDQVTRPPLNTLALMPAVSSKHDKRFPACCCKESEVHS